jgi:hypothetical protein
MGTLLIGDSRAFRGTLWAPTPNGLSIRRMVCCGTVQPLARHAIGRLAQNDRVRDPVTGVPASDWGTLDGSFSLSKDGSEMPHLARTRGGRRRHEPRVPVRASACQCVPVRASEYLSVPRCGRHIRDMPLACTSAKRASTVRIPPHLRALTRHREGRWRCADALAGRIGTPACVMWIQLPETRNAL